MKRSIFTRLMMPVALVVAGTAAGCSAPRDRDPQAQGAESGWTVTPVILDASRTPEGLRITGRSAALGRVVLRGGDGPAFATVSDGQGRFALMVSSAANDALYAVEAQRGQEAAVAPYAILVARDPSGPVALLAGGAPTHRLDPAGPLDSIDSDGHALLATGRAAPNTVIEVGLAGRSPVKAVADEQGRWSVMLASEQAGPVVVELGPRTYAYPGAGPVPASGPGPMLVRQEGGWRVAWRLDDASWRSSWFPAG